MIDDHLNGLSCSIHGSSRIDEGLRARTSRDASEFGSEAVAMRQGEWDLGRSPDLAQVAILMCTFNGQDFLEQQLESIRRQRWPAWFVAVSDDGSVDDTLSTVARYQASWGLDRISLWQGPRQGFVRNFMSFACNRKLEAPFYAWCDQDDIWHEDKLHKAVSWLQSVSSDKPALYVGRTELIGVRGEPLGYSPLFRRPPSFTNALVQNIAGGNTMVFNHAAWGVLRTVAEHLESLSLQVVAHDWWAYLLITGVGGEVFYDARPYVRYRQHSNNLIGSNAGWLSRLIRLRMVLKGRFRDWNTLNINALDAVKPHLTEKNRHLLEQFRTLRSQSLVPRLLCLRNMGLYRQTLPGNLSLLLATAIKAV